MEQQNCRLVDLIVKYTRGIRNNNLLYIKCISDDKCYNEAMLIYLARWPFMTGHVFLDMPFHLNNDYLR